MQIRIDLADYARTLKTLSMRDSPLNRLALTRVFREVPDSLDAVAAYHDQSLVEKCTNENASIKYYCRNQKISLKSKCN